MRFFSLLALVAAPLAAAIQITAPAANSTLTKGSTFQVTWSSVDTDPTALSLYLVNFVNWPPYYEPLSLNVETGLSAASVRIPCDVTNSYGYQINAINGTNVYVIYAQSGKFSIGGSDCTDPTTTASTCPSAATVTVTVSPSNSSCPTTTSYGTVPNTIGWTGPSQPVTLTSVPHGGQPLITAPPKAGSGAAEYGCDSTVVLYTTVYADLKECIGC